jgi:hypothetical protein
VLSLFLAGKTAKNLKKQVGVTTIFVPGPKYGAFR